jgi:hypothetical protein
VYFGIRASNVLFDFTAYIVRIDDWAASGLRVVGITRIRVREWPWWYRIIGKKGEYRDSREICVLGKGRQWRGKV